LKYKRKKKSGTNVKHFVFNCTPLLTTLRFTFVHWIRITSEYYMTFKIIITAILIFTAAFAQAQPAIADSAPPLNPEASGSNVELQTSNFELQTSNFKLQTINDGLVFQMGPIQPG